MQSTSHTYLSNSWKLITLLLLIDDIHDLLRALVPFGIFDEAKAIQSKFAGFLVDLQSAIPTIFVPIQLQPGRVGITLVYNQVDGLLMHIITVCFP